MSSGNPCGLSEISHFGTFQRVGGKAGGFISKKFFHPSSFRNQEKLWKAQTADEREQRKQLELEKRRDEERQVEALRKEMYLSGQGKATDLLSSAAPAEPAPQAASEGSEQKVALEQERKRKAQLKHGKSEQLGGRGSEKLLSSRYPEDAHVNGHSSVWGSWYSVEEKRWGFACCRALDHGAECPQAASSSSTPAQCSNGGSADTRAATPASGTPAGGRERQSLGEDGKAGVGAGGGATAGSSRGTSSLMDLRMVEAAERRREKKRRMEESAQEAAKTSGYLSNLLQDPTACG